MRDHKPVSLATARERLRKYQRDHKPIWPAVLRDIEGKFAVNELGAAGFKITNPEPLCLIPFLLKRRTTHNIKKPPSGMARTIEFLRRLREYCRDSSVSVDAVGPHPNADVTGARLRASVATRLPQKLRKGVAFKKLSDAPKEIQEKFRNLAQMPIIRNPPAIQYPALTKLRELADALETINRPWAITVHNPLAYAIAALRWEVKIKTGQHDEHIGRALERLLAAIYRAAGKENKYKVNERELARCLDRIAKPQRKHISRMIQMPGRVRAVKKASRSARR